MQYSSDLDERPAGAEPGGILSDPLVWYPVNALIDGVDPYSDLPTDRLTYLVYQRRMAVEALKARALITASINPEQAAEAAKAYFSVAIPVDPAAEAQKVMRREATLRDFAKMGPIGLENVKVGSPIVGGSDRQLSSGEILSPGGGSFASSRR